MNWVVKCWCENFTQTTDDLDPALKRPQ